MRVLNLVTNDEAEFFRQQVAVLQAQGVEVDVLPVPGKRVTTDHADRSRSVLDYVRYYPAVLKASFGEYDVLHANYGLTAPAALAQPNLPVVLTLWGSDILGKPAPLSRFCAKRADAVIVMSDEMAAATGTDCHVIPHGVDLDVFRPFSSEVARDVLGWRRDGKHVLFPYAKQRAVKDYPRAERVVDEVRNRLGTRPVAVEVGDVTQTGECSADGAGAADAVALHAIHGVPHDRMPLYLNAADAVLLTSKSEGSPNAIKEALACDTPVVSTPVGDVPDLVAGVRNATVASTDDELADALASVLERGEPSDGRRTMTELSAERMGERIRAVYDSVAR
ncbi:glycosyltransferase [Halorubellus sp. PRR65]|uniref:glycosyltransferase n=1 Tax=Halorubellus sp. PRR65 TaxID=3098148 RepID=UPI002B2635E1|nr:glycosyltransferase [Halorubellus sp. PRR65]